MGQLTRISVLVDHDSWIFPFAEKLAMSFGERNLQVVMARRPEDVPEGDACFILGYTTLVDTTVLKRNTHNLVVHESALPKGKGFAPMAWQILEGQNCIPVCLLEATEEADSGDIWIRDTIQLDGHELCDEWRRMQGQKTIELCIRFVDEYELLRPQPQRGSESFYRRRRSADSQLDPARSIRDQFNLLRIVDNERYPAFFTHEGKKYRIEVTRHE